jgi:hypothetical protein
MSRGGLKQIIGREPSPAVAALLAEQCQVRLNQLDDDLLRQMALMKMEGYSNEEIHKRMNRSLRAFERGLHLIRKTWEREETA